MNDSDPSGVDGVPGFEAPTNEPLPNSGQPVPPQGPTGQRGFFSRTRNIAITAGVAVVAIGGITIGVVATSGSSGSTTTAASSNTRSTGPRGPFARGTGGTGGVGGSGTSTGSGARSNARATDKPGGTAGTVSSVSSSSSSPSSTSSSGFTVTTTVGEKFTVNASASTNYENATNGTPTATTASVVTTGAAILVLGTVNGATISATQVIVEPAGSGYTTASSVVTVLQRGQPNKSQSYGTIPSYTEGQGTIVGAGTADQAVTTALKQYPGGIVDRVVLLAGGYYEVHDIGTNIHHVFENSSFQVIGAN